MTTPSQAAFEAFLLKFYPKWDACIAFAKRPDGEYSSMSSHIGWLSWQEGRKQAREEAQDDPVWQPIETAPKDGMPVLLFGGILHPEVGSSYKPAVAVLAKWSIGSECWDVVDSSYYSITIENPTHWMPLPKPPVIQELLK